MINLNPLNLMQKLAVTTIKDKVFVVAGAGCGKTRVLTYRIAYLLDMGIDEENIFAFTFTNRAASEMKYRLSELLDYMPDVHLSTFHSYAYNVVNIFFNKIGFSKNIKIIDDDEKKRIIKTILNDINSTMADIVVRKEISNIKSLTKISKTDAQFRMEIMKVFYIYQDTLKNSNLMDFDDLLYYFYNLLQTNEDLQNWYGPNTYILVDECQDINKIQYEIIKLMAKKSRHIFMVGDEDQCIYSFRGSDLYCIREYIEKEKAEVIKLEQNYRSSQNILMAANSVIKNNDDRVDKRLYTSYHDKNYKVIISEFCTDYQEAIYIADLIEGLIEKGYIYRDFTILYRNNSVSIQIERELLKRKIPYHVFGKVPFFKKKEVKLLISYLRLTLNHNDDVAFQEVINNPKRGIGNYTLDRIKQYSKDEKISLYEVITTKPDLYEIESIKKFIDLMDKLGIVARKGNFKTLASVLITELDYFNVLRTEKNVREKNTNVYIFLDMLKELEDKETPEETLNSFLSDLYLDAVKDLKEKNYVKMMTIHQAKGLEYKIVIFAGCNYGIIPPVEDKDTLKEERRLFYVAITRAKERLYILYSNKRIVNGQFKSFQPSPFIEEINNETINRN